MKKTFNDACILGASAETTGFRGGNHSHGARTTISFRDLGSTDIEFEVERDEYGYQSALTIHLGGDAEIRTIISALEWVARSLRVQSGYCGSADDAGYSGYAIVPVMSGHDGAVAGGDE
jgi:hypothetical protein